MSLAGKTLKELCSSLMHVTGVVVCSNCAMRVRAHFKNIDKVIATIKAETIKNKDCKKDFHDAGLSFPPDPVITRWATWLKLPYSTERTFQLFVPLSTIGQVQASSSAEQKTLSMWKIWFRTWSKIYQYQTLAANVEFLEGSVCTITEAYGLLKNMQFDDDPCAIKNYIEKRLSNSDLETVINCTNLTIDPTSYALLQKAQPTSAAVERSFSMLSKLLRKDRKFDVKNAKKYMMLYYNKKSW